MANPYDHDGWEEKDQTEFWNLVKRARSKRLDYLYKKMRALYLSNDRAKQTAATEVLTVEIHAYVQNVDGVRAKQSNPTNYKTLVVALARLLAQTHRTLGENEKAYAAAQTMFEIHQDRYTLGKESQIVLLYLFAEIAVETRSRREAEHVMCMLEACQENRRWKDLELAARLWEQLGHPDTAESRWNKIHERRQGWLGWKTLQDSEPKNALGEPYNDVETAAESVIVYHHKITDKLPQFSRDSLVELDEILGPHGPASHKISGYELDFLQSSLVPELGAFLGCVVGENSGTWSTASPLMHSIIALAGREMNPFRAAFERVFYERSLVAWYDGLCE